MTTKPKTKDKYKKIVLAKFVADKEAQEVGKAMGKMLYEKHKLNKTNKYKKKKTKGLIYPIDCYCHECKRSYKFWCEIKL